MKLFECLKVLNPLKLKITVIVGTSLFDILGGRFEILPSSDLSTIWSYSLQNSSTTQNKSVILE